jgi:hypothetical protein
MEKMKLEQLITGLSNALMEYIDFKKDTKKFETYLMKKEKTNDRQKTTRKNTNRK